MHLSPLPATTTASQNQNTHTPQTARALAVVERALLDAPASVPLRLVHLALLQARACFRARACVCVFVGFDLLCV